MSDSKDRKANAALQAPIQQPTQPGTMFPRVSEKDDEDFPSTDISHSINAVRARRTGSNEGDFTHAATIPARHSAGTDGGGRGRTKSRSRSSMSKMIPLSLAQQKQIHPTTTTGYSGGNGSDVTINELQQRLEAMAREKASLETALELEQERMFNQSRRLSGSMSPSMLMPIGSGAGSAAISTVTAPGPSGGGAMSPRWVRSHSRSSSVSSFGAASVNSVGITETLKADVNSLRMRLADAERELVSCYNQSQIYKKELVSLRQRLGMRVDDLYLDDPVPSTIRSTLADHVSRPRRSQSVSSGASSAAGTPTLGRRGSGMHNDYLGSSAVHNNTTNGAAAATATSMVSTATAPRRRSQRPRSVLLSPRRSMEDHHGGPPSTSQVLPEQQQQQQQQPSGGSLFSAKGSTAVSSHRVARNIQ